MDRGSSFLVALLLVLNTGIVSLEAGGEDCYSYEPSSPEGELFWNKMLNLVNEDPASTAIFLSESDENRIISVDPEGGMMICEKWANEAVKCCFQGSAYQMN